MKRRLFRTGFWLLAASLALPAGFVRVRAQSQITSEAAPDPAVIYEENQEIPEALRQKTFVLVWEKIRDEYFDPTFGGHDWGAIRERYEPLVPAAKTSGAFHDLLGNMLKELGFSSHLGIIPPHRTTRESAVNPDPRSYPDGLILRLVENRVTVSSVKPGSPAEQAGLRPGYVILKVGDTPLAPVESAASSPVRARALVDARRAVSGESASPAALTVLDENDRERTISVPRDAPFKERAHLARPQLEFRTVAPRIGYIWFDGWAFNLRPLLEQAMNGLRDTDGLIIDLRQNRGGMNPGMDFLGPALLPEPGVWAVEFPRKGEPIEFKHEGGGDKAYPGRVVILIDEASGSASEVFAAAMQEKGRAVILGRTSYGGVQNSTQAVLPTGGILHYPHSDMKTPKGRAIEGVGVIPDIPVEMKRKDLFAGKDTVIERAVAEIELGLKK
jgi:carboxyl-terminal processing protease